MLHSIAADGSQTLISLLSVRSGPNNDIPLPWVQLVLDDLDFMYLHFIEKLKELGSPRVHADSWWAFIKAFPTQWRQLVKALHIQTMALDHAIC